MAHPPGTPKPPTSGRKKGTPNKATADVAKLARKWTAEAIKTLSDLMLNGKTEQTRQAAATALLDRGHGRPSQTIAGDKQAPLPIRIIDPTRPVERPKLEISVQEPLSAAESNGASQVGATVASIAVQAAQDDTTPDE